MKSLGLYIHIPFCRSKCRYCDFCSFPHPSQENVDAYLSALFSEMAEYAPVACGYTVDTVFFGGGTPTFLSPKQLGDILHRVKTNFVLAKDAEITVECNPATVDDTALLSLRDAGFNRLSLGVQSLCDAELKALGRLHSATDFLTTYRDARRAGFDNISVDLMFGIPLQTSESFRQTLSQMVDLAPEHISMYGLIIEENTPFFRQKDTLPLPDEDTERAMYMEGAAFLESRGYRQYEISNFAKPGRESRHNLKYWHREDYLGLGLAAHSCLADVRFENTTDLREYCRGQHLKHRETVSEHDVLCETIMLAMRLQEGCDFSHLGEAGDKYRLGLLKYEKNQLVKTNDKRVAFTRDGLYVSNYILSEVLDFEQ